jgi:hypothetical protein
MQQRHTQGKTLSLPAKIAFSQDREKRGATDYSSNATSLGRWVGDKGVCGVREKQLQVGAVTPQGNQRLDWIVLPLHTWGSSVAAATLTPTTNGATCKNTHIHTQIVIGKKSGGGDGHDPQTPRSHGKGGK